MKENGGILKTIDNQYVLILHNGIRQEKDNNNTLQSFEFDELIYNFDEFNFMNKLKSKFYSLCITASQVDSWACEFEKQIGMQVKVVSKKTPFWSFHLFGPYVINYIVDEKISEEIKDFFVNNSKMNQLDLSKLNALINKTGEFKVIFMINNEIKKQLLEEIKLNFK